MNDFLKKTALQLFFIAFSILFFFGVMFLIFNDWSSEEAKITRKVMKEWSVKLDDNVKPSGVYIQWESETLPVKDGWGTNLNVKYKNEGIAERLFIRSAGEDKVLNTEDDIVVSKMQINGKGIGVGIKEQTASVAKEATKGVGEQIKESSKNAAKGFLNGLKEKLKGEK